MSNELIKITTNEEGKQLVSARELHEFLEVEKAFSTWIQTQLTNVDAIEGEDYSSYWYKVDDSFKGNVEFNGNVNSMVRNGNQQDYILTLDIAKEICMVVGATPRINEETKKLSKKARRYFIDCEKRANEEAKKVKEETKPTLTREQELQLAIFNATTKEEVIMASADLDLYRRQQIAEVEQEKIEVEQEKDKLIHTDKTYTATELAKELKMNTQEFNTKLHEKHIQYKVNGNWVLYSEYKDLGYTELKQKKLDNGLIVYYTRWTGKGRDFIINEVFKDIPVHGCRARRRNRKRA